MKHQKRIPIPFSSLTGSAESSGARYLKRVLARLCSYHGGWRSCVQKTDSDESLQRGMRVLSWTLVVSMLLQQISIPIAFAQTVEEQQPENTISIDEVETEAGILQFGATQEAGAQEKDPEDPYDPKDQSSGGADSAELPSPEPSLTNEDIGQEGSKTEPGEGPGVRSS